MEEVYQRLNMNKYRTEKDSLGEVKIEKDALYGIHSIRASQNFPLTKRGMDPSFIRNLARVKKAAALVNGRNGDLEKEKAEAIVEACDEVIEGKHLDSFIVDLIQGGAGTSANMNCNEVIANLAILKLGGQPGDYTLVHPIDDVNKHQSTNDVIPSAAKITVIEKTKVLLDTLSYLSDALHEKAKEYEDVDRIGRTQLQDAVPMKVSQEFEAYRSMIERNIRKIEASLSSMHEVNLGGTAIGSGINTTKEYLKQIVPALAEVSGYDLKQAEDLFDSTQNADDFASISSQIKVCSLQLSKMANDFRLLSAGPNGGFRELDLPDKQSGSSIMPGKINPVIPEALNQATFLVVGNDLTVTLACEAGQFELNAFLPVLLFQLFESIDVLNNAVRTFTDNCLKDARVIIHNTQKHLRRCLSVATVLNPIIGYDNATALVKEAMATRGSVLEMAEERYGIKREELEPYLNPVYELNKKK